MTFAEWWKEAEGWKTEGGSGESKARAAWEACQKDSFQSVVNEACRCLPEGWQIGIDLERGCGSVFLTDDEGESECLSNDNDEPMIALIRHAVLTAQNTESTR